MNTNCPQLTEFTWLCNICIKSWRWNSDVRNFPVTFFPAHVCDPCRTEHRGECLDSAAGAKRQLLSSKVQEESSVRFTPSAASQPLIRPFISFPHCFSCFAKCWRAVMEYCAACTRPGILRVQVRWEAGALSLCSPDTCHPVSPPSSGFVSRLPFLQRTHKHTHTPKQPEGYWLLFTSPVSFSLRAHNRRWDFLFLGGKKNSFAGGLGKFLNEEKNARCSHSGFPAATQTFSCRKYYLQFWYFAWQHSLTQRVLARRSSSSSPFSWSCFYFKLITVTRRFLHNCIL